MATASNTIPTPDPRRHPLPGSAQATGRVTAKSCKSAQVDPGAAFIAACLAPIPEGKPLAGMLPLAERRAARRAMLDAWYEARHKLYAEEHARESLDHFRLLYLHRNGSNPVGWPSHAAEYRAALNGLMLTPAPRKSDLALKRKYLWKADRRPHDYPGWREAYDADEARLAGGRD